MVPRYKKLNPANINKNIFLSIYNQGEGWQPYVERADLLVWRREHASKRGLYEYKLYGQVIQCFHHSVDVKIEEITRAVFSLTT